MKRSKFKIGQVSRLVGLAPETIRYYERKKIISPLKDGENGYRQFDIIDVCILGKARTYLRYGFSLEEAQELLAAKGIEEIRLELESRAKAIEQHVFEELAKLGGLRKKLEDIGAVRENLGRFSIKNRPGMLCYKLFENGSPLQDEDTRSPLLFENQLVTFPYLEFPQEEFARGRIETCDVGIALWENDAPSIGLTNYEGLEFVPPSPCIYTSVLMHTSEDYEKALLPAVAFLKECGMPLSGNVLCRTVSVHGKEDADVYYRDVWIPIVHQ